MPDRGLQWYKRDPIAFLDGVQGLGPELIGAFAVLLDLMYARGGKIHRDDRHLSGILNCSKRKARALTDRLLEKGKIETEGDFITNSRAKREAKSARDRLEQLSESGRKGAEIRWGSNENNELSNGGGIGLAIAREEKKREREDLLRTGETSQSPTDKIVAEEEDSDLLDKVMRAAGVPSTQSGYWSRPRALIHILKWREEGLSDDEIVAVVRADQEGRKEPPKGPKAFDGAIEIAGKKNRAPAKGRTEEEASHWLERHRKGKSLSPFVPRISTSMARTMLEMSGEDRESLESEFRSVGIAH